MQRRRNNEDSDFIEKVVSIRRVAKVVAGGRRFSFSALVVVGDGKGQVGFAITKAREVPEAIRKGIDRARKHMIRVPLMRKGMTVPYEVWGRFGTSRVMLKPATEGTGVIAGTSVRSVLESAGVHNVLTKAMGSNNPINVVSATFEALRQMQFPADKAARRGKTLEQLEVPHLAEVYRA